MLPALSFSERSDARNPGVVINDLSVKIDGAVRINNVSEAFSAGHWTCILGPSGVGKTLILKSILGLISPRDDSGIIVTGKVRTTEENPVDGNASYMAQQDLLLPWLTVRENIELGSRLRKKTALASHDTDALIEAVGLKEYTDSLPGTLSGGMRQRTALARTLKENRPIIVMDEPFSAVDAITRLHLQDLASQCLTGRTVVMVTHDPMEALRLSHRVLVLSGNPATFKEPIIPDGLPPRSVQNPCVLELQGRLLASLQDERS